jgi:hypothetical protein
VLTPRRGPTPDRSDARPRTQTARSKTGLSIVYGSETLSKGKIGAPGRRPRGVIRLVRQGLAARTDLRPVHRMLVRSELRYSNISCGLERRRSWLVTTLSPCLPGESRTKGRRQATASNPRSSISNLAKYVYTNSVVVRNSRLAIPATACIIRSKRLPQVRCGCGGNLSTASKMTNLLHNERADLTVCSDSAVERWFRPPPRNSRQINE